MAPTRWTRRLVVVAGLWVALVVCGGVLVHPARALLRIPLLVLSHLIVPMADVLHYPRLRHDNATLRHTVTELTQQLIDAHTLEAENARLRGLLELTEYHPQYHFVAARIVGRDPTHWTRALWIDKGQKDGLEIGTPVIVAEGVVGKIVRMESRSSFVQLVTDASVRMGAVVSRTRDQGIVQGDGASQLRLTYLSVDTDTRVGDYVTTSGLGGVYPRGLPIGRVVSVETDASQLYSVALLEPAARLGRLAEVSCLIPR